MEELKLVNWYINVFEEGKDTRHLVGLYDKLKKDHAKLMVQHEKTQFILQSKLKKANSLHDSALKKLQKQ